MTVIEKLNDMISGIQFAMLTSVHATGALHSRPMATQAATDDASLWFFSRQHSTKIDEIRNDHQVNLSYADPANMRFVSVTGTCELVRNRSVAAEFWRDEYKRWFPRGVEDPDLILLKVTINSAEYWDVEAGRMRTLEGDAIASNETVVLRERREIA